MEDKKILALLASSCFNGVGRIESDGIWVDHSWSTSQFVKAAMVSRAIAAYSHGVPTANLAKIFYKLVGSSVDLIRHISAR
jgi:hypothetical protein